MDTQELTQACQRSDRSAPLVPAVTGRLIPALVNGEQIFIECPPWCTLDHVAQNQKHLEEVWHGSDTVNLYAPDGGDLVLFARLGADPYCLKHERRVPFVVIDDGSDCVNLTPQQAETFADNLLVFAAQVRAMARTATAVTA